MDNKPQEKKNEALPKKKDPCRKKRIDFHLCEKTYGFNDNYCKCTRSLSQTTFLNTRVACKAISNSTLTFDIHHCHQYLSLTVSGGSGSYDSRDKRAAVIKFFLIKLSTVILSSGSLPAWKLTSSKTALKEYGSLVARLARILRLSPMFEWVRELMKRL